MRIRMPIIGTGAQDDVWRPKYKIPSFQFFYEDEEVQSQGVQKHYDLPEGEVEITLPDELGKKLLSKFGVEEGGDVSFISDESPEEALERGLKLKEEALRRQKEMLEKGQVPF